MDFIIPYISKILEGLLIGGLFGYLLSRISRAEGSVELFSKTEFRFLEEDVKQLNNGMWNKVGREELMSAVNQLTQRILVIETIMKERDYPKAQP